MIKQLRASTIHANKHFKNIFNIIRFFSFTKAKSKLCKPFTLIENTDNTLSLRELSPADPNRWHMTSQRLSRCCKLLKIDFVGILQARPQTSCTIRILLLPRLLFRSQDLVLGTFPWRCRAMKRSNAICKWNGRENAGVVGIFTGWMLAFQLADRRATFFFGTK